MLQGLATAVWVSFIFFFWMSQQCGFLCIGVTWSSNFYALRWMRPLIHLIAYVEFWVLQAVRFLSEHMTALHPFLPLYNCLLDTEACVTLSSGTPQEASSTPIPKHQFRTVLPCTPFKPVIRPRNHNQSHCIEVFYDTDSLPQCLLDSFYSSPQTTKTKQRFVVLQH